MPLTPEQFIKRLSALLLPLFVFQVPFELQSTLTPRLVIDPLAPAEALLPPTVLTQPSEGTTPATASFGIGESSLSLLKLKPIESAMDDDEEKTKRNKYRISCLIFMGGEF